MTSLNFWSSFFVAINMAKWYNCIYYVKSHESSKYKTITEISSSPSLLTCVQKCRLKNLDVDYKDGKCYCVIVAGNTDGEENEDKEKAAEVYSAVKDPSSYLENGHQPASINLSRGKPARQSSVLPFSFSTDAPLGVDGNTSGKFNDRSCFHTLGKKESSPWWEVVLLQNAVITNVVLYPRTDNCCHLKANNLKLLVRFANQDSWNLCASIEQLGTTPFDQKCDQRVVGGIFRLVQHNTEPLHLCEVEVFGYFL
ncbi:fucolectin-like [Hydractinia symbiolongicarpus]|uniref:fucolectin-like n=1 Tax=Hydractinia symbiolongicarpus TaxID=13093 RepID=UPI002550A650|nr:fucolectin-like [Hydractinia symbiolongicarpus]